MALERVSLTPGYRKYLEFYTGVKREGTACYMCARKVGQDFPNTVERLVMDHLIPLEADEAIPGSAWEDKVMVHPVADYIIGPRSNSCWEVRRIDAAENFAPICDQCNNMKGGRACLALPSAETQAVIRAFHVAKWAKNRALFNPAAPILGDLPADLQKAYAAKARRKTFGAVSPTGADGADTPAERETILRSISAADYLASQAESNAQILEEGLPKRV